MRGSDTSERGDTYDTNRGYQILPVRILSKNIHPFFSVEGKLETYYCNLTPEV